MTGKTRQIEVSERAARLLEGRAAAILEKSEAPREHSRLGRPVAGRDDLRALVLGVVGARYVVRYGIDGERLVMMRVFHARERR